MNSYLKKIFIINSVFIFADSLFVPLYALFVIKIGGGAELAGILFGLKFAVTAIAGTLSGFIIAFWGFQALFLIMSLLAFIALGLLSLHRKKSII